MSGSTWEWNARKVMSERGMYKTSALIEPLRAAGIQISREQVYRIVTQPPLRITVDILVALCEALDCEISDLITIRPRPGNSVATASAEDSRATTSGRTEKELPFAVTVQGLHDVE